ncbi:MAG TPA: septum formation initiator family protein, partial [Nitrospirota bacterium]|nr:septum formation initiator family protein [Nitrospirota bacterium]
MRTRVSGFIRRHRKILLAASAVIISSYLLLSFMLSDLGIIKYISMKGEYNRIRDDVSRLDAENKKLMEEVEGLKTDPDSIEALARQNLGLAKEGEIIYKFQG